MHDTFSTYHPLVNFSYFTIVILAGMFFIHPLCLVISFFSAFCYSVYLKGMKAIKYNLKYMLPMMLIAALINPAFNHEGATILLYLDNGNPLTLESIYYGIAASCMLVTVMNWFYCYNEIMTSDKFIYLFGRMIPSLSLILSMTLRFVPKFNAQIKIVSNGQKCIGRDVSNGGLIKKIKHGIKIISIMITWSLENAIETADSMKSRGYGLHGRTAFSIYRFDKRDTVAMCFIAATGIYTLVGAINGNMYFRYFPYIKGVEASVYSISTFTMYLMLCLMPVFINLLEDRKWKLLKSRI